jgi:hypothetical protein
VLLDPLEEQLDLPAQAVQLRDRERQKREVVREEVELLAGLRISIGDAAQMIRIVLNRRGAGEAAGRRSGLSSDPPSSSRGAPSGGPSWRE